MDHDDFKRITGKSLSFIKPFEASDTFHAYNAAEEWLAERGYSVGRMCSPSPTGVAKGDFDIQKWKNLDRDDKKQLDGVIVGDFRNGPVTILLSGDVDD